MSFPLVGTENSYRLRVPKYGAYFEFVNFALLLFTFVLCLSSMLQLPSEITKPYHLQIVIERKSHRGSWHSLYSAVLLLWKNTLRHQNTVGSVGLLFLISALLCSRQPSVYIANVRLSSTEIPSSLSIHCFKRCGMPSTSPLLSSLSVI